jgi:hypothetical protein
MAILSKSEIRQEISLGDITMLRRLRNSRRADGAIVAIIAASLIVLAIVALIVLVPVKTLTYDQTQSVEKKQGVNTMELSLNADIADVHLYYEDLANSSIEVRVQAKAQVSILDQSTNIMKFTVTSSVSGNKLLVNVLTDLADWLAMGPWSTVNVTAVMDKSLFDSASVNTGTGSIWLTAHEGSHVNATSLRTSVGDVTVNLHPGAIIGGSMSATTTTGMITLECDEAEVAANVAFAFTDTTGSINAKIVQLANMEHNLSVQASTVTGSITYAVEIAGTNGGQISASTNLGKVNVVRSEGFNTVTNGPTNLQSTNYPGHGNVVAVLQTNLGQVNVDAAYAVSLGAA